jgi:hypothetical protein
MITACGRFPFSNIANLSASARLTKSPPRRPRGSRTTQSPRLFWPMRKSEDLELVEGLTCFMRFCATHSMMGRRGRCPRSSANLRSIRIVDLASSVPTLASLFGRLDEMMLGVCVRIPRYVWNVAKPRGEPGPGIAEAGVEKTVTKAILAIRSLFMMTHQGLSA